MPFVTSFLPEIIALAVGFIWAASGMFSTGPARAFGGMAFNRWRMNVVTAMLLVALLMSGTFEVLPWRVVWILALSGLIGIFLGDTLLFIALARLGPRRNHLIFTLNAPFAAILAVSVGQDTLNAMQWLGLFLVLGGVMIAILYGKRKADLSSWEEVRGPLWIGILISLGAAACQAVGLVVSDIVIDVPEADKPPVIFAALIRVAISAVAFNTLLVAGIQAVRTPQAGVTGRHWTLMVLSGFAGMGLGMTMLVWAQSIEGAEVSLISALSQTTPVWTLLLLWAVTRQRPAALAFVGAGVAVAGVFLITVY